MYAVKRAASALAASLLLVTAIIFIVTSHKVRQCWKIGDWKPSFDLFVCQDNGGMTKEEKVPSCYSLVLSA
jgi:hypothetical protein